MFAISLIQQLGPRRLSRSELFILFAASIAALLLALFGKGIASLAVVGLLVLLLVIITLFEVAGYERSKSDDESTDNTDAAGLTR